MRVVTPTVPRPGTVKSLNGFGIVKNGVPGYGGVVRKYSAGNLTARCKLIEETCGMIKEFKRDAAKMEYLEIWLEYFAG